MRTYKPRTPGVRHLRRPINDHLWKGRAYLPLTFPKKGMARGGRNNTGRITVRHRGGGHKRRIRMVDFRRRAEGPQTVERIEYDPNRSAHIALLSDANGEKSYIIAAEGMRAGDTVQSYMKGIPKDLLASMGGTIDFGMLAAKTAFRGNCLPIHLIPVGTQIYNIGFQPNGKAVFCRSAGTYGVVVTKEQEGGEGYVIVRLQSGEVRKVHATAPATIGVASNTAYHFTQLGKAGRKRWMGIRPTVRGVAMNAVDHPHGGGRGKSKGNKPPVSPWGILVSLQSCFVRSEKASFHIQPHTSGHVQLTIYNRRKAATRHARRGTPISTWFKSGCAIRESAEASRPLTELWMSLLCRSTNLSCRTSLYQ
ncbi:MAG: 50S ribosomal protein L2 [Terriglobus roseus]|nr:50S ribosomal protein L2 [Terriglobus roseus]